MSEMQADEVRVGARALRVAGSLKSLDEAGRIPEAQFESLCEHLSATPDEERREVFTELVALALGVARESGESAPALLAQLAILAAFAGGEAGARQSLAEAGERIAKAQRVLGSGVKSNAGLSPAHGAGLAPQRRGVGARSKS